MDRRLRRFFVETSLAGLQPGSEIQLSSDQTIHLRKVLRLQKGDTCLVTDGAGHEAHTSIKSFSAGRTVLKMTQIKTFPLKNRPRIRLFSAMIQKAKIDFLVEKLQELEIEALIPVETAWTVVKMSQAEAAKAAARWQRLAQEAAKQSGASRLIKVEIPVRFSKALDMACQEGEIVLFHPGKEALAFAEWIKKISPSAHLNLFFGPEAGFTDAEAEQACKKGCSVKLTETLLKADTAALGVAAALRFLFP